MTVETGFEIIDAIINNPIEAVGLFGAVIFLYKWFFGCGYTARENRHAIMFELKWKGKEMLRWLERRSKKQFHDCLSNFVYRFTLYFWI